MVVIFHYLFLPFNVDQSEHTINYLYICLIQSFIAVLCLIIIFGITGLLINDNKWNIIKEFLLILSLLLVIGLVLFVSRDLFYHNTQNWSLKYYLEETRNSMLAGFLIFAIYYPFRHIRLLKEVKKTDRGPVITRISINSTVKGEHFLIDPDNIIYVKSDGNYIEVISYENNEVKKVIKRITIKDFEKQLSNYEFIVRVHRSFIANIKQISDIKGGAQGLLIKFKHIQEKIPVSRSFLKEFKRKFSTFSNVIYPGNL